MRKLFFFKCWTAGCYNSVSFCQGRNTRDVFTTLSNSYCGGFFWQKPLNIFVKKSFIDIRYGRKYASEREQWKGPITHRFGYDGKSSQIYLLMIKVFYCLFWSLRLSQILTSFLSYSFVVKKLYECRAIVSNCNKCNNRKWQY